MLHNFVPPVCNKTIIRYFTAKKGLVETRELFM